MPSTRGPARRLASWSLDFGDGTAPAQGTGRPTGQVAHTDRTRGTFTPTLTVTDRAGATHSHAVSIKVKRG